MRHLGWDIILLPSSLLSHSTMAPPNLSATANNTSVSAEATETTCLFPHENITLRVQVSKREEKRMTSGARLQ